MATRQDTDLRWLAEGGSLHPRRLFGLIRHGLVDVVGRGKKARYSVSEAGRRRLAEREATHGG